jgi:hypothetical protein
MMAIIGCALLLCIGSWAVGRSVLLLTGGPSVAAAPAVGLAVLTILSDAALNLGGEGTTAAIVMGVAILAGLIGQLRVRPAVSLAAAASAAAAAALALAAGCIPFLANGRVGTLGVSVLNDLAIHEYWTWARNAGHVYPGLIFPNYPLGAHSLVGALSELTGVSVDRGFAAALIGVPALIALTAHGLFTHLRPGLRAIAAALGAFPYLSAALIGEGAFKEPMVVLLVLGFATLLCEIGRARPLGRAECVPLGLLAAACCLIEGRPGLAWPVLTLAVWGACELVRRRGGWIGFVRTLVVPALIALAVMLLAVAPSLRELVNFSPNLQGSNLQHYLPFAETMGIWFEPDFRGAHTQIVSATMLVLIGLALLLYAAWWWARRRGDALLAAALAALIVYAYVRTRSNAYLTGKAQMVWAGLYMVVVVGAVFDLAPAVRVRELGLWGGRGLPQARRVSVGFLRAVVLIAFAVAAARSTALTLRAAYVDSDARTDQLAPVRRLVGGQPTIMLVADDFASWQLRGARQASLTSYGVADQVPFELSPDRPPPTAGVATDFASVTSASLDRFRYAVTTASAFSASAPPNWRMVFHNQGYDVWRRTGPTPRMSAPPGATGPIVTLDCRNPAVKALLPGSIAIERGTPVVGAAAAWRETTGGVPASNPSYAAAATGTALTQTLRLRPGTWDVSLAYQSGVPLQVTVGATTSELPADLDVFGPYWRVAVLHSAGGPVTVTVHLPKRPFPGIQTLFPIGAVVATPLPVRPRRVPAVRACGHAVDWLIPRRSG